MVPKCDEKVFRTAGLNPAAFHVEVRYNHWDEFYNRSTIAEIHLTNGEKYLDKDFGKYPYGQGMATCNMAHDRFCKKTGRIKAIGRAIADLLKKGSVPLYKPLLLEV